VVARLASVITAGRPVHTSQLRLKSRLSAVRVAHGIRNPARQWPAASTTLWRTVPAHHNGIGTPGCPVPLTSMTHSPGDLAATADSPSTYRSLSGSGYSSVVPCSRSSPQRRHFAALSFERDYLSYFPLAIPYVSPTDPKIYFAAAGGSGQLSPAIKPPSM